MKQFDVVVLGAGPGGFGSAVKTPPTGEKRGVIGGGDPGGRFCLTAVGTGRVNCRSRPQTLRQLAHQAAALERFVIRGPVPGLVGRGYRSARVRTSVTGPS